jgi:hypothetical protein
VAYTGKQPLAVDVKAPLDTLLAELNDDGDLLPFDFPPKGFTASWA